MNDFEKQRLQALVDRVQTAVLLAEYAQRTLGNSMDDLRRATQAVREAGAALQQMREGGE